MQFWNFTMHFGHILQLFPFSYEGQKSILRAKAEGRDADGDRVLKDDAVRIHRKYCKAGDAMDTSATIQVSLTWL